MITIRSARLDDFPEYSKLYKDCFRSSLSNLDDYKLILESGNRFVYLAEDDGVVVGMIYCFYINHPELKTTVVIQNLGTSKEHRKQGIATKLVKYLLAKHRKCCSWFEVIDNSGGITGRIVEKLGFESVKKASTVYRVPAWLLLKRNLTI